LGSEYPFSHPAKKVKPYTWKDELTKIVISNSPYNDLQGPLRPSNVPTAKERAEKKVLKVKRKLGIPDVGLVEGLDPAAGRRKDGGWRKIDEIGWRKKKAKEEAKKRRKPEDSKRRKNWGGTIMHEEMSQNDSISMAASLASRRTLDTTSSLRSTDGRRRGFSVGTGLSKKQGVNPRVKLSLVESDKELLSGMEGEVPIEQWRNELSRMQLALGHDGDALKEGGNEYMLTEERR